jgi:hypothetical protein
MKEATFVYTAPTMDEVDIAANACCGCGCGAKCGQGGGNKPDSKEDVEDMLDKYYRDLHKNLEDLKKKYPDYQHPDFPDN